MSADETRDAGASGSGFKIPYQKEVGRVFNRFGDFLDEFAGQISIAGVFLKTEEPEAVGTTVGFNLRLTDGYSLLKGVGEVLWNREPGESGNLDPGMALLFCEMDRESQDLVTRVVETHVQEGGTPFDIYNPPAIAATPSDSSQEDTADAVLMSAEEAAPQDETLAVGADLPSGEAMEVESLPDEGPALEISADPGLGGEEGPIDLGEATGAPDEPEGEDGMTPETSLFETVEAGPGETAFSLDGDEESEAFGEPIDLDAPAEESTDALSGTLDEPTLDLSGAAADALGPVDDGGDLLDLSADQPSLLSDIDGLGVGDEPAGEAADLTASDAGFAESAADDLLSGDAGARGAGASDDVVSISDLAGGEEPFSLEPAESGSELGVDAMPETPTPEVPMAEISTPGIPAPEAPTLDLPDADGMAAGSESPIEATAAALAPPAETEMPVEMPVEMPSEEELAEAVPATGPPDAFGAEPSSRSRRWLVLLLLGVVLAAAAYFGRGLIPGLGRQDSVVAAAPSSLPEAEPQARVELAPVDDGAADATEVGSQSESESAAADVAASAPVAEPIDDSSAAAAAASVVESINWTNQADGLVVAIEADGRFTPGFYEQVRIDGERPREVLKLFGITESYPQSAIAIGSGGLERIRIGHHSGNGGGELHLVFDLAGPAVEIREIRERGARLEIELGG